jgi:hypothetical protein
MVAKLFACVVAGALLIPGAAFGKDGKLAIQPPALDWKSAGALPLAPIRYVETIPWLSTEATGPRQNVDQLLGPDLDTLKFALVKDSLLMTRDSSMRRRAGPQAAGKSHR